jgi:uncharacterized membrane protein YecN with MAPEG domain
MRMAVLCTGLLGVLVFGLGLMVSLVRGSTRTNFGYPADPTDRLYKLVRAHGNATEYAPMFAVLILYLGAHEPSAWLTWVFAIATVCRYLHAAGMVLSPSLDRPQVFRFVGALGTYVTGLILAFAVLV